MLAFAPLHDAVGAAGTPLSWLTDLLEPLAGGMATAAAIVLFTIAVRLLISPLTVAQVRGERRRAALAPQVRDLQQRYADDPATLQREVFALYREAGANPIAGCLPLLLQAPFLLVLYRLFTTSEGGTGLLDERLAGVPLGHHLSDGLAGAAAALRRPAGGAAGGGLVVVAAGPPGVGGGRHGGRYAHRGAGGGHARPAAAPAAVHDRAGGAGAAARRGDLPGDHERVVGARAGGAAPTPAGGSHDNVDNCVDGTYNSLQRALSRIRPRREARPHATPPGGSGRPATVPRARRRLALASGLLAPPPPWPASR